MEHFTSTLKDPVLWAGGAWVTALQTTTTSTPLTTIIVGAITTVAITLGKYLIDQLIAKFNDVNKND